MSLRSAKSPDSRRSQEVPISPIFLTADSGDQIFMEGRVVSCRKTGENGSQKKWENVPKYVPHFSHSPHFSVRLKYFHTFSMMDL